MPSKHPFRLAALLFACVAACAWLSGCSTPPLLGTGSSGAAAGQEGGDSTPMTIEPLIALEQPGGMGGARATRLSYGRQNSGTQAAPQLVLNLQPAAGSTVAASYPQLTTIQPVFVVVMGNAQQEGALTEGQIDKVANVVDKAKDALQRAGANAEKPGE